MNIIVCAKQVIDISEMKVDSSTKKPILQGIPFKISDIDKNAMETAITIKEKNGGKIIALTVGTSDAKERIKELLAMGADEGVLVTPPEKYDYHVVSMLLAEAIKKLALDNSLQKRFIKNGHETAELYTISAMVENTLRVYEKTLKEKVVRGCAA